MTPAAAAPLAALRAVWDQYRLGLGLFVAAPLAVALVVVPEFAQHVVEVRIGLFDSRAAARALSGDPTRWAFGMVKIAGLVLAFLACARVVWARIAGGPAWHDLRAVAWGRLLVGLALFVGIGLLAGPLDGRIDPRLLLAANVLLSVLSIPFLFVALAGLFADRATPWRGLLRRCWPAAVLLVLLMLTGFAAMQALHSANHLVAFGRPRWIVWLLMLWDSLVVGAIAATTGAALALAYRAARDRVARHRGA